MAVGRQSRRAAALEEQVGVLMKIANPGLADAVSQTLGFSDEKERGNRVLASRRSACRMFAGQSEGPIRDKSEK